jgi:transcription termination factor NusB
MSRNIGQKIIKYLDAYKKIQPLPNRIPGENTEFKRFVSENCKNLEEPTKPNLQPTKTLEKMTLLENAILHLTLFKNDFIAIYDDFISNRPKHSRNPHFPHDFSEKTRWVLTFTLWDI